MLKRNPISKDALRLKAEWYYAENNLDLSLKIYKTLISLYETREELEEQIDILTSIGDISQLVDDYEQSIVYYSKILNVFESVEEPLDEHWEEQKVLRLYDLGEVAEKMGKYEDALLYYQDAAQIHTKEELQKPLIDDYSHIAKIYIKMGKEYYAQAKTYYKKTLSLCEDIAGLYPHKEPHLKYELGKLLMKMGEYEQALEYLPAAMAFFREFEQSHFIVEESDTAIRKETEKLVWECVDKVSQQIETLLKEGKISKARELIETLLELLQGEEQYEQKATLYYYLSVIAFERKDYSRAKEILYESIQILKKVDHYQDKELYERVKRLLERMKASQKEKNKKG